MTLHDINNYFGDIDLFLMDLILKGKIPNQGSVLDVGCGEGRNAVYFIQQGYRYIGLDPDLTRTRLLNYFLDHSKSINAYIVNQKLEKFTTTEQFDMIVCSRVFHFYSSKNQAMAAWDRMSNMLSDKGILYFSMESALGNQMREDNMKTNRLLLDQELLAFFIKGYELVEPVKTITFHGDRSKTILALRKN
jgi:SAM-dependent methyltransferase